MQAAMMIVFCGIRGRLVFYHQIIIVIIIATHRGTYICILDGGYADITQFILCARGSREFRSEVGD